MCTNNTHINHKNAFNIMCQARKTYFRTLEERCYDVIQSGIHSFYFKIVLSKTV